MVLPRRLRTALALGAVALVAASCGGDSDDGTSPAADTGGGATPATPPPTVAPPPSEDVPSALDDAFDERHPDPLVDPADIRPGGPPPDGIPPVDEPVLEPVDAIDWIEDVEPVIVLDVDGDVRAYPLQIMTWHEIVNDTVGGVPVTVTYCPLCNSAVAFDRRSGDRVLDFGTSGRLYNSSLVMYDRQTESLWTHFDGTAVVGHLTGTELERLPVTTVSWADYRAAHPEGLVLSRDTGVERDYGRNPYPGYDDVDTAPFLFDGVVDDRLAAKERVVVVRAEDETVAVVLDGLLDARVLAEPVDGAPIVALLEPGTSSALDAGNVAGGRDVGAVGVFSPEVDGDVLTFEPADGGGFVDEATGSTWDVLGRAIDGPLAGRRLEPVEHLDTFWFAIAAFEPDTRIVVP